jgi:hypothetical protein
VSGHRDIGGHGVAWGLFWSLLLFWAPLGVLAWALLG